MDTTVNDTIDPRFVEATATNAQLVCRAGNHYGSMGVIGAWSELDPVAFMAAIVATLNEHSPDPVELMCIEILVAKTGIVVARQLGVQ